MPGAHYRTLSVVIFALTAVFLRAEEPASRNLFMWKVTSDTGGEVYLLGSIHMMKKETYPLPKEMEDAFARSKFLVLEADTEKGDQAKLQQMALEKGMYTGDDTLSKKISKPTLDLLNNYAAKSGFPASAVEKMKPWLASLTLTIMAGMKMGLRPELGIDHHFQAEAKAAKKEVLELESAEFQINLLAGFSEEMQEKSLAAALIDLETMEKDLDKMIAAWSRGDAVELEAILTKKIKEHAELKPAMEKLFDERNIGMAGKIKEYLKTKDVHFVIAGAGHMVGEKGIVKLLQKENYKVEQMKRTLAEELVPAGAK